MKKLFSVALVLCLLTIVSGYLSIAAAFTAYTSEADFVATLDDYYYPSLQGLLSKDPDSLNLGPVNGFSFTITASTGKLVGIQSSIISTYDLAESLLFTFTGTPVNAFGGFFWATDWDMMSQTSDIQIDLLLADGSTQTYAIENAKYDAFIGFTSLEAFTSITVSPLDKGYWETNGLFVSAHNLYVGSASSVPVPGAVWLLGTGLMGLVGLRRKKYK